MYCFAVVGSTVGAGKNHLGVFNAAGSGKVVRIWRVEVVNHQAAAVTGLGASFLLCRTTTAGGGTAAALRKADLTEDNPPAQVTGTHTYTSQPAVTAGSELAEITISTEETSAQTPKVPLFQADANAGVPPVVVREGGGVVVQQAALASAGAVSVFVWFTVERW